MLYIKKRKYKPLYKKFLKLRTNVQNRQKILFFRKRKWQKFKSHLKKISRSPVLFENFKLYDHYNYFLPKFDNYFSNNFRYNLQNKQRFSLFYGGLKKKELKRVLEGSLKKSRLKKIHSNFFLIEKLENRLDTILYRSHFMPSIRTARQYISHKLIYVNKKVIQSKSFKLKKGDLIEIDPEFHNPIELNILESNLWPLPPKHIQVNYKTFQIIFVGDLKYTNFSIHFPFWLDVNSVRRYYKS